MVRYHALFTGLFRNEPLHVNVSAQEKVDLLKQNSIDVHWYTWKGYVTEESKKLDINIVEIDEPENMSHSKSVIGRQRQILNSKKRVVHKYLSKILY